MGKINLEIDDSLEREFRIAAVDKFEARKGFLKKAIEEAIRDWLSTNDVKSDKRKKLTAAGKP